jgi:hypothetical protein
MDVFVLEPWFVQEMFAEIRQDYYQVHRIDFEVFDVDFEDDQNKTHSNILHIERHIFLYGMYQRVIFSMKYNCIIYLHIYI